VFDPGSVHVGFVVDKVVLGQVSPRVLRYCEATKPEVAECIVMTVPGGYIKVRNKASSELTCGLAMNLQRVFY
jgi:hypothetical protein